MTQPPVVTILTYCAHPVLAYGTLLVFKSLRVGFPTARIEVFDNASHPEVRGQIADAARLVGATFHPMTRRHYTDYYRWLLAEQTDFDSLVIVDPDIVFWSSIEDWHFGDALLAGRLIPNLVGKIPRCLVTRCLARLHPSLLWVPDMAKLRHEMDRKAQGDFAGESLFTQRVQYVEGTPFVWDTLAGLYQAFPDRCHAFTAAELDCYDHLFYGAHFPIIAAGYNGGFDVIREAHQAVATGNIDALRGIWRKQQAYFDREHEFRPEMAFPPNVGALMSALDVAASEVQQWQSLTYSHAELKQMLGELATGIKPRQKNQCSTGA